MISPKDIGDVLGNAGFLSDGETSMSGFLRNDREVIKLAATVAARKQVTSVLEALRKMQEQVGPGDSYDLGFQSALESLRQQIEGAVYPFQVVAQSPKGRVLIIDHAFTLHEAQKIADEGNRKNGDTAKYTVEEAMSDDTTETNKAPGYYHDGVDYARPMALGEVAHAGGKVSRVRLLTELRAGGRLADVSYIHATLPDGTTVPVTGYPVTRLLGGVKGEFIQWATEEGVSAKDLGLLDNDNWSVMY